MSYSFDQNKFGNNYNRFNNNVQQYSQQYSQQFSQQFSQNASQPQMPLNNSSFRNEFHVKQNTNYQQLNYVNMNMSGPRLPHNYGFYRPPQQQPYYGSNCGPNSGAIRGQYRAQVIDYTNSSHNRNHMNSNNSFANNQNNTLLGNESMARIPSHHLPINQQIRPFGGMASTPQPVGPPSQPLIVSQTGLLPTPNSYSNTTNTPQMIPPPQRAHLIPQQPLLPLQNRGLLPIPNSGQVLRQPFQVQQQQQNSFPNFNNETTVSQTITYPSYGMKAIPSQTGGQQPQSQPQSQPQPQPPPQKNILTCVENNSVAKSVAKGVAKSVTKSGTQSECESLAQQKVENLRNHKMKSEGMQDRLQNDLKGFYCLFCEVFCNNVVSAERHVETPKHHRTKIGDNLRGIDAKFTIKSERISDTEVALARKEELLKISNVVKNDYFNEGIRLKDGIGSNAYVCENCGVSLESLTAVKEHLELHKLFTEQLKVCSKPIIGLDFITEYIDSDPSKPRIYECSMCQCLNTTREIITHVCSFLHRTNFIKRIHPSEGAKYTAETPELSLEAGKRALELETLVGRGHYRVNNQSTPHTIATTNTPIKLNISEPVTTLSYNKPIIQIELPKPKADHEKSELEKLFSVSLSTEEEANEVTQLIKTITDSVMEYHLKGLTPHMREKLKKQLQENEESYQNIVK